MKKLTTVFAIVLCSAVTLVAQTYSVTDLGTFGGATSGALAVNDSGQVAGWSDLKNQDQRAFVWSKSQGMKNLGLLHPSDSGSTAYGINNSGQVVGISGVFAFLWTKATGMTDLGNLGGSESTHAYGINNLGEVVGDSLLTDNFTQHAFLWTSTGGMQDLGTLGGNGSTAYAINDSGQVVGLSVLADNTTTHAFLWTQADGMIDIGTLGGPNSAAFAISASGEAVGNANLSSTNSVAFTWTQSSGMRAMNLGSTVALGVNASGQAVGYVPDGATQNGFLWTRQKGVQNLNSLLINGPRIDTAYAINKKGQIAGASSNNTDSYIHALLLTPTTN